jgi:hypothetical protein
VSRPGGRAAVATEPEKWAVVPSGLSERLAVRLERVPDLAHSGGLFSQEWAVPHCQRKLGVTANVEAAGSTVAVEPKGDTQVDRWGSKDRSKGRS